MGLTVRHVSKSFGTKKAVDSISFSMDEPGVFGLIGTNGAGKTTTIRMILGVMRATSSGTASRWIEIGCVWAICPRNGEFIPKTRSSSSWSISANCGA